MKSPSDRCCRIRSRQPERGVIQRARDVITAGGVVAFPTRCLYGLGADAFNTRSLEKIFSIKRRSRQHPILVLIDSESQLGRLVKNVSPTAVALMDRFWPGQLTLVFEAAAGVPEALTAGCGRIGIRLAGHPVARALVRNLGVPLTATSANLSGSPGVCDVNDLPPAVAEKLDLIIDAGPLAGGPGSTVVDVTVDPPRVIRQGVVPASDLKGWLVDKPV